LKAILLVAIGGALGSVSRFGLGSLVLQHTLDWKFPAGTFAVNVLGCLVAGLLAGLGQHCDFLTAEVRIFLFTGFLGGFTTFSAFGVETVALLERGDFAVAALYVASSVVGGIAALWAALNLAGMAAG